MDPAPGDPEGQAQQRCSVVTAKRGFDAGHPGHGWAQLDGIRSDMGVLGGPHTLLR